MQHGFSLLEVLVTLFILSLGLFGFAETELKALRELQVTQNYNFLQQQMLSLDEQLQSSSSHQSILQQWQQQLKITMPQVSSNITALSTNVFKITLVWQKGGEIYRLEQTCYV